MSIPASRTILTALAGGAILGILSGPVSAFDNPKAKVPPQAKPQRRAGAEGVPPLPLPATPMRRTERKRQPAPPALVGMIRFPSRGFETVNGRRRQVPGFPTTQIDIEQLMRFANKKLGVRYRYVGTSVSKFSWDPVEIPLLYLTGWTEMPELEAPLASRFRRYLHDGGTMVFHSQCGRKEFTDSARREIAKIFPDRELALLDSDSELFRAYYRIEQMRVRQGEEPFITCPPLLEGVYLGCRPAIIFSPIDLNCGWDVVTKPIAGGTLYHQADARKLGVNIITATLANLQYGRSWGAERILYEQADDTRDQLVLAQLVHNGDWDPTPHALANLVKYIRRNTTISVQAKRQTVNLQETSGLTHPVIYVTGLRDFTFTDKEVKRLREFLASGGMLVADAAAGRKAFDVAFRREIGRVLADSKLAPLPADSTVYQIPLSLARVSFTELAKAQGAGAGRPALEGAVVDGQLAVIYSSLGLSNGWEQLGYAYNRGYGDTDALRLGVNVFSYVLSH